MKLKRIITPLVIATIVIMAVAGVIVGCSSEDTPTEPIIKNVSPAEAHMLIQNNRDNPDFAILDVRTPAEYADGFIEGAFNIDVNSPTFREDVGKLEKNKTYLVYCRSGNRSATASGILEELGFNDIFNMTGGILDWEGAGFPVVKPASA